MSATIASPTVAYQEYADREVKWLGLLPGHWKPQRLGTIAEMRVSNVDKHSKEEELPVRLCNYVDVYKNDHISRDMPFMRATASTEEIGRFRLRKYDVLITKDSETWDDIGVPALVTEPADDLISGYHLALLRPNGDILGPYLFRTLQSRGVAQQFHIGANGVTRYGLTHNTIRSVILPLPPLDEQAAIVRYLDDADQRIRAYVSAKERLIALLEEERQAVIHQAVTKGLDPNVKLKPSGVEWLGDVPEHWDVRRLKSFYTETDERSSTGLEELISVSHKTGVTPRKQNVTMFLAESNEGYKVCRPGDIVVNTMWAYMAALGVSRHTGLVSPSYGVYRPINQATLNSEFVDSLLRTEIYRTAYLMFSKGITESRLRLYADSFLGIHWILPPPEEQAAVVRHIGKATSEIEAAIDRARRQIELMEEYRTRLIADVVTGKIDVREAANTT